MLLRPLLNPNQSASKKQLAKYVAVLLVMLPFSVFCQELDIKATVNTSGYIYETQIGDEEATQGESILVKPSIVGSYSSRRLSASLSANHSIVKKNSDSSIDTVNGTTTDSQSQNYTDFKYTSTLTLIENAMTLSLNGTQGYRNISQQQNYFSDKILDSKDLTKTTRNSAQLSFSIPNPLYLGFNLQGTYSQTKSDRSQESTLGLDNDNLGVVAKLYQGKNVRGVNFDVSAQYNDTSRSNLQNFKSTRVQANFGFPIVNKIEFFVTGGLEEYDSGNIEFSSRSNIDTSSYGAGLKWNPSNERTISLTYNQLDEGDKQTNYVGLDLAWAFTSRTALNFDYSKRFFGDSYRLGFKHSLKSLRTSVTYSEDVTSFSRLGASTTTITGIFVCEFGSTDLADCFQPDSLDYQLQAGEEFRATTEIDTDITEEVLFRKTGTASIGYDKRKIKVSINANYSQTEYLESDRINTNRRLSFNFNYALSRKTNISFASTVAKNQRSELEDADTIVTNSLDFKRNLTRQLKLSVGLRLLDRKSDTLERDGSDKRLTVGLNYTF
ncbi:TIGR03016 family PEP-CTERM system-associated outer membrane protein [uncultured Paraglaciecola sp.]|uniref:TIGR03016 family PEP-CTERM system-associated outer membrane protein n=1 Tax=uncultured Paraglaciecola sp. TaxID=1765024 RepID=UPI0025FD8737|nr:TIGR03016 family PEP-CTERM system-associated outer membrane protein [uncultured Paraglaciecola sp.]